MKLFRSLNISAVTLIIVMGLSAGCDRNDTEQPDPVIEQHKTINFFHYFTGPLHGGIEEMVARVNEEKEGSVIVSSGLNHESFKAMIPVSLDRGVAPELFSYWAGERVQQLVDKNQLLPIDDLWAREDLSSSFSYALVESAVMYNGQKYLLPITQHIVVLFYNKQIFKDFGLTPPSTWPEFISLCEKVIQQNVVPIALGGRQRWPVQLWFDYLLLRSEGPAFRERLLRGDESFTAPQVVNVFRIWSEMLQKGFFNQDAISLDWEEAVNMVKEGKAAMTLMGTWALQAFGEGAGEKSFEEDYDFFPFPTMAPGVPHVALGPIDGIVISRTSENHELAEELLAYFASPAAQKLMSTGSGSLSPNSNVPDSFYSPFKLRLKQEIARIDQWVFNFDLAAKPNTADRGLDCFTEFLAFPSQYLQILTDLQNDVSQDSR